MQQQPRVGHGPNLQLDFQIPAQHQRFVCGRRAASVSTRQHSELKSSKCYKPQKKRDVNTYHHVTSPAREVSSWLQRIPEAGHRPLAVGGAPCRGLIQRQVPDAADEAARTQCLKFTTENKGQRQMCLYSTFENCEGLHKLDSIQTAGQ